jgi:hypothetical protein
MIHVIDNNTRENLKNELRNQYPNLTEGELNNMDESVEKFISSVSLKIHSNEQAFAEIIKEKLEFIHSKAI